MKSSEDNSILWVMGPSDQAVGTLPQLPSSAAFLGPETRTIVELYSALLVVVIREINNQFALGSLQTKGASPRRKLFHYIKRGKILQTV